MGLWLTDSQTPIIPEPSFHVKISIITIMVIAAIIILCKQGLQVRINNHSVTHTSWQSPSSLGQPMPPYKGLFHESCGLPQQHQATRRVPGQKRV